ncbi:MAG: hypothetical protein A2Z16_00615 [Chloroflexi bacterium RBG_16_54_18]|nr:MAG: hypothetical protein A2Z16_00615 [Chloroflexi bacterium RBG_16_54_18]
MTMIKEKFVFCLIFLAIGSLILPSLCLAESGQGLGPFTFDGDLNSLPLADLRAQSQVEALRPGSFLPAPIASAASSSAPSLGSIDYLIQYNLPVENIPSPILDFPGMPGGNPPDTNGVVGPNHYIQTINVSFEIWDKQGSHLAGPTAFTTLFASAPATGTPCDNGFTSDPVVLYDPQADRFILTILAFAGFQPPPAPPRTPIPPFYECIAVSKTSNPVSGGWHKYVLLADNTNLNDFPKLAVWPDAYYMSANMFSNSGFSNVRVWALDKSTLLSGGALNEQHFDVPSAYYSLLPSNMNGTPPPAGAPNVFAAINYYNSNVIHLWNFHVDWAVPANSTFGDGSHNPNHTVTVSPYTLLSAPITQPGTNVVFLDTLGDRLQYPAQYRNVGGTQSLWLNHPVDTGSNVSGVRWYEIRDPSSSPTLYQQGTWNNGGDGVSRWMGAMGVDRFGNMAIGYNVSSSSVSPGIRYAGRLVTDALGTLGQGEATLIDGSGNIINCTLQNCVQDSDCGAGGTCTNSTCSASCTGRWGDYSGMWIDPVDDCTFWFTGEYVTGGGNVTRIGNFALPGCDADLSVTKTGPTTITVGSDMAYSIAASNGGPVSVQFVTMTDMTPSNTTFVSFTQNTGPSFTCTTPAVGGTGSVNCTIAALADGDSATFTLIVHVEANASGTIINTAQVSGQELDPETGNNRTSVATIVIESADLQLTKQCKPDTPIPAGGTATCTILVTNLGSGEARNVAVTDTVLSSGPFTFGSITTTVGFCSVTAGVVACNLGDLAVSARATITVEVSSNDQVDINDTASVTSSTLDPNPANNTATGAVHFTGSADLAITKTATPPFIAGTNVTYTINVINNGPSAAPNVVVTDTLPSQLSNVSFTPSQGSCIGGIPGNPAQPLTCTLGSLANGASATITVVGKIDASTPSGTYLNNNASVSSGAADPNNGNNSASAVIQVLAQADLAIDKTSDKATYKPSSLVTYTVTVKNLGPSDAQAVVVTDALPDLKQAIYKSDTGGCTKNATNPTQLTCNLGALQVAQSRSFQIYLVVKGSRGNINNTVSVSSSTTDPVPTNNSVTKTVKIGK